MAISKQEIVAKTVEYLINKAQTIASEEMQAYEKEFPNAFITTEVSDTVRQRASSEAMIRACNFKCASEEIDEDMLTSMIDNWFMLNENERLHAMCKTAIREEMKKIADVTGPEKSFTERFREEAAKKGNTIDLLRGLQH